MGLIQHIKNVTVSRRVGSNPTFRTTFGDGGMVDAGTYNIIPNTKNWQRALV